MTNLATIGDPKSTGLTVLPDERFDSRHLQTWSSGLRVNRRRLGLVALAVILLVFGIGGIWASTARIGGAVVSSGHLVARGTNRVIQHLEGGIVEAIFVKEGDQVRKGQVLAEMDTTADQSQLDSIVVQQAITNIQLARWRAEQQGESIFDWSGDTLLDEEGNARISEALSSQLAELAASTDRVERRLAIYDTSIATEERDIVATTTLIASIDEQLTVVRQEFKDLQGLLQQQLVTRSRVNLLERTVSQLDGQKANAEATVARSQQNIQSYKEEQEALEAEVAERANQNITRLQSELTRLADIELRLRDRIDRSSIRAMVDGVVFRINLKTEGSVLQPGQTLIELFPKGEQLTIESLIPTQNIEPIQVGQEVEIVFASEHRNALVPMKGTVSYVSADSTSSEGQPGLFYVVRATFNPGQESRNLLPGNVGDVYVRTEPKTLIEYLVEPITRFAKRSFTG